MLPPSLTDQGKMLIMDRFEAESMALLPGQRVRVRILSHHPWGVKAEIIGHEQVGASADLIGQPGAAVSPDELPSVFPRVGAEIDAVVQQVRRWDPPARVRLSIRPADLESFTWPCDFCGEPVILSAGRRRPYPRCPQRRRTGEQHAHLAPGMPGRPAAPGQRRASRILGPGMADGIQPA